MGTIHFRKYKDGSLGTIFDCGPHGLLSRGGVTIVFDYAKRVVGVALCSDKDAYNKRVGRAIAISRFEVADKFIGTIDGLKRMYIGLPNKIWRTAEEKYSVHTAIQKLVWRISGKDYIPGIEFICTDVLKQSSGVE